MNYFPFCDHSCVEAKIRMQLYIIKSFYTNIDQILSSAICKIFDHDVIVMCVNRCLCNEDRIANETISRVRDALPQAFLYFDARRCMYAAKFASRREKCHQRIIFPPSQIVMEKSIVDFSYISRFYFYSRLVNFGIEK